MLLESVCILLKSKASCFSWFLRLFTFLLPALYNFLNKVCVLHWKLIAKIMTVLLGRIKLPQISRLYCRIALPKLSSSPPPPPSPHPLRHKHIKLNSEWQKEDLIPSHGLWFVNKTAWGKKHSMFGFISCLCLQWKFWDAEFLGLGFCWRCSITKRHGIAQYRWLADIHILWQSHQRLNWRMYWKSHNTCMLSYNWVTCLSPNTVP